MDIIELINKKRLGKRLTESEIQYFVDGTCNGTIKDFQVTSLLMAICINGLDFNETLNLTLSMAKSGNTLDLSSVGVCVDKHSTGGVSDTTTLVVVPILASLGVKVAKMSGRSLGFTGGTADKMEVFKGYKTDISCDVFKQLISKNNASIISQSEGFAKADKIIYKLRSESGTVESMGLIASSIMSKKIACGAKIVVLDCKYGSGAFMKTKKDCIELAKLMVKIGKYAGLKVCAIISSMCQPLTEFIGNNFEVYSSLQVLSGKQNMLCELATYLSAEALVLDGKCKTILDAKLMATNSIQNGSAMQKLKQIVASQGGSIECIDNNKTLLPKNNSHQIISQSAGYISKIDTEQLGYLVHDMQKVNGAVQRQDDAGILLSVKLGDKVNCDDKLATMYYNSLDNFDDICGRLQRCFVISSKQPNIPKLIEKVIK